MKNILISIIVIVFLSCNEKKPTESDFEKNFGMYSMLINEIEFQSFYLEEQISYELSQLEMNDRIDNEIRDIDSITKLYVSQIDQIIAELNANLDYDINNFTKNQKKLISIEKVNEYFFAGDSLSEKAKSYKALSKKYSNKIIKYFDHPLYIKQVQGSLSMEDFQDRYSNKTEIINYLYRDTPLIAVITQLKSMKRNSLEFEQQLLLKKPVANIGYK